MVENEVHRMPTIMVPGKHRAYEKAGFKWIYDKQWQSWSPKLWYLDDSNPTDI